jgi:tRNA dimethylallyltransferase
VARRSGALILSVDSMQVYRGMDIGTAKPTVDDRRAVPHAMIDLADPDEEYSVARFQREARRRMAGWAGPVVIVGGSGLHFRAVVDPLEFPPTDGVLRAELEAAPPAVLVAELERADPDAGQLVDLGNPRRVIRAVEILRLTGRTPSRRARSEEAESVRTYRSVVPLAVIGLDPGEEVAWRVRRRLSAMRRQGFLAEVESLADRLGRTACQAVGYRQLLDVVRGRTDLERGFASAERATMMLAKRQRTYFRRDPRIHWLEPAGADLGVRASAVAELWENACSS